MNSDIRISTTFFEHHKTKKLIRRLGLEGVFCLQKIWVYAGQYRPDGILHGMTGEDIAVVVDWMEEPDALIGPLCEIGFIELSDKGVYLIHDWATHNPYAAHAKQRSEKARRAAQARWGSATTCSEHATSIPLASSSNAPSPTPSPTPKDTDDSSKSSGTRPKACSPEQWDKYLTYSKSFLQEQQERWGKLVQISESRVLGGAKVLDNLVRVKGFSKELVQETLEWARDDDFWSLQLRSLGSLLKKSSNGETKFSNILAQRAKEEGDVQRHAQ